MAPGGPVPAGPTLVAMRCPNCGADDPKPPPSDNGTTTCPRCGHRFPVDETEPVPAGAENRPESGG